MLPLTKEGISNGPLTSAAHSFPSCNGLLTVPVKEFLLALARRQNEQFFKKSKALASSFRTFVKLLHLQRYLVRSAL